MEMWGDPEAASRLDASDRLVALLLQVAGPAHIPWNDPRWHELLLGYDVWVHVEHTRQPGHVISLACKSMAKHACNSSNLAALCLHVCRMTREIHAGGDAMTGRIALVGKARATAGSMKLLRTLLHDVPPDRLADALWYKSRDVDVVRSGGDKSAGTALVTCLFNYLCSNNLPLDVPEVYDATVTALELLLVLLSTSQLYQPMVSSMERKHQRSNPNYFILDYIMEDAQKRRQHIHDDETTTTWSPKSLLQTCLGWQLHRPDAPTRSNAHHSAQLIQNVISAKGDKVGPDGMYETHVIVMAQKPQPPNKESHNGVEHRNKISNTTITSRSSFFFDATKGVLVLSSSLILLPFRLMTLALGLLGRGKRGSDYNKLKKQHLSSRQCRTNDVLWLTHSPVADLSTALILLLGHNYRAGNNPFRAELAALNDNRWDEQSEMESFDEGDDDKTAFLQEDKMSTNFEALFDSFGSIVHTELGALLLYTMYQSSPSFAASMAVRSDLDTLVVPLLRTLYFSSSIRHYSGKMSMTGKEGMALSPRNCPFRSPSQLYLILILLLLFSQDASFGPDAFRRNMVSSVPWYRERHLKDIALGSLLLLTLLRSITFNLNRLQDAFFLSNCCAILMNLSPHVVHLHDYAAMRLASVTISCLKKYSVQLSRNGGGSREDDEDVTTPIGMYGEVSRTLLALLRHCISPKNLDKNLHLVYALVYNQAEFKTLIQKSNLSSLKADMVRVEKVIQIADKLVQDDGDARTAAKAYKVLASNMEQLQAVCEKNHEADFTFSYEEEADPEIFFVPYIWEVTVCVATASTIDWDTNRIQVFPLLQDEDDEVYKFRNGGPEQEIKGFARDMSDVV